MSAQSCSPGYPGDPYQPNYPAYPYQQPTYYGTGTATLGWSLTEDRIREIFREELSKALEALKDKTP